MQELNRVFSLALREKLIEKVVGKVSVRIQNDSISVWIDCYTDIRFRYRIDNFADKIYNGYTTDYATYEVLQAYKKYLFSSFLR